MDQRRDMDLEPVSELQESVSLVSEREESVSAECFWALG
jgi:hypothetical protein